MNELTSRDELTIAISNATNALKWALHYAHAVEDEEGKDLDIVVDAILDALTGAEVAKVLI